MKPADSLSPVLSRINYANAMKHIQDMLPGANASLNEDCICSINAKILSQEIQSLLVTYDKIRVENNGSIFYWPIVPYTEEMKKDFVIEFLKNCTMKL